MKVKSLQLGATGRFPRGQAGDDDEGELRLALAADRDHGIVRVAFGKPVGWLGLDVVTARLLAKNLLEKADEVERGKA